MLEVSIEDGISVFQIEVFLCALLYELLEGVGPPFVRAINDNFFFYFDFSEYEDVLILFLYHKSILYIFLVISFDFLGIFAFFQ